LSLKLHKVRRRSLSDPANNNNLQISENFSKTARDQYHNQVMDCSEPIMSPRGIGNTFSIRKAEISEAVKDWSGENIEESPPSSRKKSSNFRSRLRRSISRSSVNLDSKLCKSLSKESVIDTRSPRKSKSHRYSAKYAFEDCLMEFMEIDPRITPEISLFYLLQQLPETFPTAVIDYLYSRFDKQTAKVSEYLISRGWDLNVPVSNEDDGSAPSYYFGAWSYDCWCVFEGAKPGSFITCHKQSRYYLMYKEVSTGKVVLESMLKGPRISSSLRSKFSLTNGLNRPPMRYICDKCDKTTPCEYATEMNGHASVLQPFKCTFPH